MAIIDLEAKNGTILYCTVSELPLPLRRFTDSDEAWAFYNFVGHVSGQPAIAFGEKPLAEFRLWFEQICHTDEGFNYAFTDEGSTQHAADMILAIRASLAQE